MLVEDNILCVKNFYFPGNRGAYYLYPVMKYLSSSERCKNLLLSSGIIRVGAKAPGPRGGWRDVKEQGKFGRLKLSVFLIYNLPSLTLFNYKMLIIAWLSKCSKQGNFTFSTPQTSNRFTYRSLIDSGKNQSRPTPFSYKKLKSFLELIIFIIYTPETSS